MPGIVKLPSETGKWWGQVKLPGKAIRPIYAGFELIRLIKKKIFKINT